MNKKIQKGKYFVRNFAQHLLQNLFFCDLFLKLNHLPEELPSYFMFFFYENEAANTKKIFVIVQFAYTNTHMHSIVHTYMHIYINMYIFLLTILFVICVYTNAYKVCMYLILCRNIILFPLPFYFSFFNIEFLQSLLLFF